MRRSAALDGGQAPDTQLNDRITALKDDMTRLSRALANVSIRDGELGSEVSNLYAELQGDWARAKEEYAGLDAETKEDGWLQRFRECVDVFLKCHSAHAPQYGGSGRRHAQCPAAELAVLLGVRGPSPRLSCAHTL